MIHFAFPNEKESDNFSWIYDRMHLNVNLLLFVVFIEVSFFSLINPPDEGLILTLISSISGMVCAGSVCKASTPPVEEILELHACSCG